MSNLKNKSKIIVGNNILANLSTELLSNGFHPTRNKIYFLFDQRLEKQAQVILKSLHQNEWKIQRIKLLAGEKLKSLQSVERVSRELIRLGADRQSVIVAFGGGSIGDVSGFVASIYMRGISWVVLPSTLLSQVDSCVGGKTGVHLDQGKNVLGSFYLPQMVVCDTALLKTLPKRELISGVGEIIKYGISLDKKLLKWTCKHLPQIMSYDLKVFNKLIQHCLKLKTKVITKDLYEKKGYREVLNFGHTFGHALEAATNFKRYQHGEAVIWGMYFAIELSKIKKRLSLKDYLFLKEILDQLEIPPLSSKVSFKVLLKHMKKDKKASQKRLKFVLLTRAGKSVIDNEILDKDLLLAFNALKRGKNFER